MKRSCKRSEIDLNRFFLLRFLFCRKGEAYCEIWCAVSWQ
nr:MAG TPA: hypothetical protein [Caudoviricetes sp.]